MNKASQEAVDRIRRHIDNACEKLKLEDYDTVLSEIADYIECCQEACADEKKR